MMQTHVTDAELRRVLEAERLADARPNAERALRFSGFVLSPQQRAVLDILDETRGQHPTARDIFDELRKRHPRAAKNLVYLILRALEGHRLVAGRRFANSATRWDARVDPHVDVFCKRCGGVEEVEIGASGEALEEDVKEGSSRSSVHLSVVSLGICRECSGNASGGNSEAASKTETLRRGAA